MVPSAPVVVGVHKGLARVPRESLTTGGECAVYGVKIDVIHGKYEGLVFDRWCLVAPMALERKIIPIHNLIMSK
jgi:hypothetical protein